MKKLLLVIDMLKDFCTDGGSLSTDIEGNIYAKNIIPFVTDMVKEFDDIVFICDSHKADDLEFARFPIHCVEGTEGAQLIDELKEFQNKGRKIFKQRYSSFYNTDLEDIIKDYDEFHIVGVCTNICVLYTVEELCNRDLKVILYEKGVASFDPEAHDFALRQIKDVLGATIK